MNKRYYTVVYEITNEEAFKHIAGQATASMDDDDDVSTMDGAKVVACGNGDTMTAYDALAQHLQNNGFNVDDIVLDYCEESELDGPATIG